MSPERWQQIDEVLEQALDLNPENRATFIAEVCAGNDSLRREVLALLSAHDKAGSFIETPPATAAGEMFAQKQNGNDLVGQAEKLIGQTFGHYQILSLLGKGGMGEVYLAQDTRLGRKLALKLLPASFTQDAERLRRFHQEARTASALNHPNIITVYDIGQFDGLHFIATEFIEGETLRTLLQRKNVSSDSLLELLAQVADGLAKAHGANIVHRDLKPENVMRTRDGFAKVLDFGVAKLVEPRATSGDPTATAATLMLEQTKPGILVGTLGYMSPEQAQGKEIDQRTDIFSFGCMLYEIVTGRRPFEGASLPEVLHKIVYEPAPPVTDFNPQCPTELQRIIRKCLNKDPEKRYQSVKDIAIDLRELNEIGEIGHAATIARDTVRQKALEKETLQMPAVTTGDVERELSDDDPAVQKTVRFSRMSFLLLIAGILGLLAIGPAYRKASIDSELKFAFSKDVAINKAQEDITNLGYNPSGLARLAIIRGTDLDLNQVAIQQGVAQARLAVRVGDKYLWTVIFKQADSILKNPGGQAEPFEPKQGEFSVSLSTQGRMMSFKTKARDDAPANEVSKEEIVALASDAARRLLATDISGYAMDFSRRSKPPGMTEIVWRAPQPLFAHQEVIRTELQEKQIISLSRNFEPLTKQTIPEGIGLGSLSFPLSILLFLITGLASIIFLIKKRTKAAFTSLLPIVATFICMLAMGAIFFLMAELTGWAFVAFFFAVIAPFVGIPAYLLFAGGFALVQASNPTRLHGMRQLIRGRLFSGPVAASLIHGLLGGATLAGIAGCFGFALAVVHGYSPQTVGSSQYIFSFGFLPVLPVVLFGISTSLVSTLIMAVAVELLEKNLNSKLLQFLILVSLITVTGLAGRQGSLTVMALTLASILLTTVVTLFLYRSKGFAVAWLASACFTILPQSIALRHVGEPSFTWQGTYLLVIYFVLLAIGIWGYVGNWVIGKFRTIEVG